MSDTEKLWQPKITPEELRQRGDRLVTQMNREEIISAFYLAAQEIERLNEAMDDDKWPSRGDLPIGTTAYTRVYAIGGITETERVEF